MNIKCTTMNYKTMSVNVSNEVTSATLYTFILKITNYEPGITDYIKDLCGVHPNESLDKWFDIISKFVIKQWYPTQDYPYVIRPFTLGHDALPIHNSNIVYYGDPIKNKTVHKHCEFLKEMYKRQCSQSDNHSAILDTFNWLHICNTWSTNGASPLTDDLGHVRTAFFSNFTNSSQYCHNHKSIWFEPALSKMLYNNHEPALITKCDVIFWTMNQRDMYDNNCIDNDSNNVLELIYHVPKHLARDTPGQDGYDKISYFIQGCVATAIAKHIKKMPLYTKFNPILQQQEYNKNYMGEYIKQC